MGAGVLSHIYPSLEPKNAENLPKFRHHPLAPGGGAAIPLWPLIGHLGLWLADILLSLHLGVTHSDMGHGTRVAAPAISTFPESELLLTLSPDQFDTIWAEFITKITPQYQNPILLKYQLIIVAMKWIHVCVGLNVKMLKCIISAPPRSSLPVIEWDWLALDHLWIFDGVRQTWDTQPRPRGEERRSDMMWHLQPIRGRGQADLTNQRPAGLRNMNQQQGSKERKRKKTVVFFLYLFSKLLSVYLLSSEPWMGLELPLSWHLSFISRWSPWYPATQNCRGKSTNKFGPITSQHGPQWRLLCSINCVWELLEGLRFIPQLSWRRSPIIAFICWLRQELKESQCPSICLSRS